MAETRFVAIDLSQMTAPDLVEEIDFETVLTAVKTDFKTRVPDYDAENIESDPAVKTMETGSYRETLIRQRVNDAARAVLMAVATGNDLDHIGALLGTERAIVTPADPNTNPATPAVYETDDRLRVRIQLAWEAASVAGPEGAYEYFAYQSDVSISDVLVTSPSAGKVDIIPMTSDNAGIADATVIQNVLDTLDDQKIRPLTDDVEVRAATSHDYAVDVTLSIGEGPDPAVVESDATAAIQAYADSRRKVGKTVYLTGLISAATVSGVESVTMTSPTADFLPNFDGFANLTGITITVDVLP